MRLSGLTYLEVQSVEACGFKLGISIQLLNQQIVTAAEDTASTTLQGQMNVILSAQIILRLEQFND